MHDEAGPSGIGEATAAGNRRSGGSAGQCGDQAVCCGWRWHPQMWVAAGRKSMVQRTSIHGGASTTESQVVPE